MNVQTVFEEELRKRGLTFSIDQASARHVVETDGGRVLVCLDNLKRDVVLDGDVSRITRFVDAIIAAQQNSGQALSATQLYWNLEPSNHTEHADFRVPLSHKVDRVLVYLSPDRRLITWVTQSMIDTLGMSESDAASAAFANLAMALREATLTCKDIDGVQLGMLGTKLPFKAALLLAPNIKEVLGVSLGWPLMAIVPDRDFLYLWAAQHREFYRRVGGVVVREYERASYPISTEIYEISDDKIRPIGEFPARTTPPASPANSPTMKIITYRGGIVQFRIPADWQEEYDESGGGTFFKPGDSTGTLRLNVMTFKAPRGKPVTTTSVAELLAPQSEKHSSPIVALREGVAMTQWDESSEENGEQLRIRMWHVAQVFPPDQIRILVFTYTLLADQFAQPAFLAELAMLDREIAACKLASVLGKIPPAKKKRGWFPW